MPHRTQLTFAPRRRIVAAAFATCLAVLVAIPAALGYSEIGQTGSALAEADLAAGPAHLVVSEVMTGGESASDEFVELYNPTVDELPLEGLELVYVTASGSTVTRKATWPIGAAGIPPGAHLLVANEAGAFASLAEMTYAGGFSATGGSVALRVAGEPDRDRRGRLGNRGEQLAGGNPGPGAGERQQPRAAARRHRRVHAGHGRQCCRLRGAESAGPPEQRVSAGPRPGCRPRPPRRPLR